MENKQRKSMAGNKQQKPQRRLAFDFPFQEPFSNFPIRQAHICIATSVLLSYQYLKVQREGDLRRGSVASSMQAACFSTAGYPPMHACPHTRKLQRVIAQLLLQVIKDNANFTVHAAIPSNSLSFPLMMNGLLLEGRSKGKAKTHSSGPCCNTSLTD